MFDILIVGGGHAGVEAANIASQFKNLKIGIISLPEVSLASAPCNPAIGGVGKGQVVKEIDCLGGIIGKLADLAGIQYRVLNESKGYAVQSTRIQIDKELYTKNAEKLLAKIPNLEILRGRVIRVEKLADMFTVTADNFTVSSKKLIMTVGTFLNGKMHTGPEQTVGGRQGCQSSPSMNSIFSDIKTCASRFKTGTPARLDINSINYSVLEEQPSDDLVFNFHVLHGTSQRFIEQKSCFLAYTNVQTMELIRRNKELSPLFNGQIKGVGARYCPSIEDKAYRYPDKNKHHVFIEPESHSLNTVYPSGISTSLPKDCQLAMVQTIEGLENCTIEEYGYAVEYDVIDTTQLDKTLEMQDISGLYFAGQVNGTSGYEEAAGQGYIAGVNAALSIMDKDPLILSRNDSYIGVMIEDLVSNTRDEPYRLFTARSENRLSIREDNAANRMYKYRSALDLDEAVDAYLEEFNVQFEFLKMLTETTYLHVDDEFLQLHSIKVPRRTSLAEVVKQSRLDPVKTMAQLFEYSGFIIDPRLTKALAVSIKYDGYISKSSEHQRRVNKLEDKMIAWEQLMISENISFECKQRIKKIRPTTFGQLKIIEGIRPATLIAVAGTIN